MLRYRLVVALIAAGAALAPVTSAKAELTMADLTAKQKAELEERMQRYAHFSSGLAYCGRDPRLAERLSQAVAKCVARDDLATLRRRFKQLQDAHLKDIRVPAAELCKKPDYRSIIDKAEAAFEDLIAEAYTMCRRCVIC